MTRISISPLAAMLNFYSEGDIYHMDGHRYIIASVAWEYIVLRPYTWRDRVSGMFWNAYDAIQSAYDEHSDFIHGMMAGAVLACGIMWTAYEVMR